MAPNFPAPPTVHGTAIAPLPGPSPTLGVPLGQHQLTITGTVPSDGQQTTESRIVAEMDYPVVPQQFSSLTVRDPLSSAPLMGHSNIREVEFRTQHTPAIKAALGESWRVTAGVRILFERGGVYRAHNMSDFGHMGAIEDGGEAIPSDCVRATLLKHWDKVRSLCAECGLSKNIMWQNLMTVSITCRQVTQPL